MAKLKDRIAALVGPSDGHPAAMLTLARLLRTDGQEAAALAQGRAALALVGDDTGLGAEARAFLNEAVPEWHFTIVRDKARNDAYDAALRRAVGAQTRVLEIGAGTGLLAMMAARAGAASVVTCEMSPIIAETAAEIVAANGYAERVRVIAARSDQLRADDIGGRADLLVSEIVSSDLLGEGVLSAHEHAGRDLLKPGARVIPARGAVRVALAYDARDDEDRLADVHGFDLSPMTALRPATREVATGYGGLTLRSEPADLFVFDFAASAYCPPARATVDCASTGGRINVVAQWLALELDAATRYENRPGSGAASCWAVILHRLPQPLTTSPGQPFRIFGAHDRHRVTIWSDRSGPPGEVTTEPS